MKTIIQEYLTKNYSYEYLKAMLKCVEYIGCDTIILGSSYGLHGVDTRLLTHQVNISMTSQDLEYDNILLQHVNDMSVKNPIKRVILLLGEYAMFDRMRHSKMGRTIIESVYEPILSGNTDGCWDFAEASALSSEDKSLVENACFDLICSKGSFFNDLYTREDNCEDEYRGLIWNKVDSEERKKYAKLRASKHNRLIESEECLRENREILNSLAKSCEVNKQELLVVIPPFTREYEEFINPAMKVVLLDELNNMPYPVHYYDLNDSVWDGIFDENDFFDMDHLNDSGAEKLTRIILGLLDSTI